VCDINYKELYDCKCDPMILTNTLILTKTLYKPAFKIFKYFSLMMTCIDRNYSPLFKLIKQKIVVFDEVHILFHINITLKHNGISSTRVTNLVLRCSTSV
jgi:hypothetical protein